MVAVSYLNFDLLVERFERGYRARVIDSPAGQATAVLPPPPAPVDVERFLSRVGLPYRGRPAEARPVADSETDVRDAVVTFGARLFEFLFVGEVRASLRRSLDEANRRGAGLRIRLRMADAPALADVPWEFLYDPTLGDFPALSAKTPLVRYLDLPRPVQPVAARPPLRILVAVAGPTDAVPLDADREWRILRRALADLERDGRVALERLEGATIPALQRKLRRGEYHVFHFIGHGVLDAERREGVLLMEDAEGYSAPLSARRLGALLHDEADTLRLVVLNACHGARGGAIGMASLEGGGAIGMASLEGGGAVGTASLEGGGAVGTASLESWGSSVYPFAGLAQEVVRKGIPAVVAMQFAISDDAAVTFAREYYRAIADGYPVDAAFGEARKAVYLDDNEVEWATPVLFMRAPDGALWDMAGQGGERSESPGHPEQEEGGRMDGKEEGAWWDTVGHAVDARSVQAEGDVIIGYAGAGATGVAIGKDITQNVYGVLGEPTPDDRGIIERELAAAKAAVQGMREQLDAATATMAEFQLELLQGELTKTEEGEAPSASTITRVGDWLLDNVPPMAEILAGLFATPAVGRVVGKAGQAAVDWVRRRLG